jgi:hypothetical protein
VGWQREPEGAGQGTSMPPLAPRSPAVRVQPRPPAPLAPPDPPTPPPTPRPRCRPRRRRRHQAAHCRPPHLHPRLPLHHCWWRLGWDWGRSGWPQRRCCPHQRTEGMMRCPCACPCQGARGRPSRGGGGPWWTVRYRGRQRQAGPPTGDVHSLHQSKVRAEKKNAQHTHTDLEFSKRRGTTSKGQWGQPKAIRQRLPHTKAHARGWE